MAPPGQGLRLGYREPRVGGTPRLDQCPAQATLERSPSGLRGQMALCAFVIVSHNAYLTIDPPPL